MQTHDLKPASDSRNRAGTTQMCTVCGACHRPDRANGWSTNGGSTWTRAEPRCIPGAYMSRDAGRPVQPAA